jgi:outer membrane immunogenic protein
MIDIDQRRESVVAGTGDIMRGLVRLGVAAAALSLGLTSIEGGVAPAHAADMPRAMPVKAPVVASASYNWSGLYGGIHGGYGWGDADYSFLPVPNVAPVFAPVPTGGSFSQDLDGGIVGGHFGYNQQMGHWVAGVEASFSWSGLRGSSTDPFAPVIAPTATYKTNLRWMATLTPRLGYAANNWLVYAKGGLAAGQVDSRLNSTAFVPAPAFQEKNDHVGWTVGAGIEYAATSHWIVGLEYNYVDLGSEPYGGRPRPGAGIAHYTTDLTFSTLLARLSYKHDAPAALTNGPGTAPVYAAAAPGTWTGFYAGIHGGYGWGDADYSFAPPQGGAFAPNAGGSFGQTADGGTFGGHLGFNYQLNNVVIGLEGSLASINFSATSLNPFGFAFPPEQFVYQTDMTWLVAVTPRLGYAANNLHAYVKGGLAAGRVESVVVNSVDPPPSSLREKTWHVGWTVGAGIEYAMARNWVVGIEYNYLDLGRQLHGGMAISNGVPLTLVDYDLDLTVSTVLARLSYRFGAPAPVVARY